MHKNTKVVLDTYTELRRRLNGKCGGACPINCKGTASSNLRISNYKLEKMKTVKRREELEFCSYCEKFHFINSKINHCCPCNRYANPEEISLYLDEFIEELQEQLSKEYSS